MDTNDAYTDQPIEQSMIIGVFDTSEEVTTAMQELEKHGFAPERVSVITSQEKAQELFPDFRPPAGPEAWKDAVLMGTTTGGVLAGLVTVVALATGATLPVVVAGGFAALLTGGIVGGLTGVMTERGFEPDSVDYYVMAVADGRSLVAVELLQEDQVKAREITEILHKAGSEPIRLDSHPHLSA